MGLTRNRIRQDRGRLCLCSVICIEYVRDTLTILKNTIFCMFVCAMKLQTYFGGYLCDTIITELENVLVVVRKGSEQVNGSELYNETGQFSIMGTECALRTLYVTAKKADIG